MTNDDRSNEDRPTDGQPRYGERAEPASTPQYGEQYGDRDGAPRYGEQTPQDGDSAPQYGQQQYGQQQYGQQQYGQGEHDRRDDRAGAPVWNDGRHQQQYGVGPDHGAPAWQSPEPARKKKTVGVVAFIVALLALALAVIAGAVLGNAFGSDSGLRDTLLNGSGATQSGQQQLERQMMDNPALLASGGGAGVAAIVGTLLGIWAIIQGIIAIVTKRGRAFGVVALIIAVVSPIVLYIVLGVAFSTQL
ncbi:DUF308 domain-containing protein [Curtobacterium sp. B8]|uniref:DUF308 domain-containing protein n=1 Tax=Curtobacterium sp. B8 TaxID=95611 RepID=UPI00034A6D05|nr:DUF308 domain-containing protein [Curtobacterium sp. B8]